MPKPLVAEELKFKQSDHFRLEDVTCRFRPGAITSIIGPNGSGKSTLLRLLAALARPTSGRVMMDGIPPTAMAPKERARMLAVLTQTRETPGEMRVRDLVAWGRLPHRDWFSPETSHDRERVEWALCATGMDRFRDRPLGTLSGGERQRAWISMALAQEPDVLLLDEPTTFLDIGHQLDVLELVESLNREWGLTVGMVLHDIAQAAQISDDLVVMKEGRVVADGPVQTVLDEALIRFVFDVEADIRWEGATPIVLSRRRARHTPDQEGEVES
ncbi:ABC transporter ATP-binding protein [Desmospora profundinema]|uniref:Iron complex transport system ATP-binding protein n=1 Tax=Desmospora profundinema TaxID=1571184 RepID=A0ABU1IPJ0_9BACL|nr:ABC transporter ATP-binding protein [Desmospora profundinema]MDR6226074.1 iron complex transport system ATP-binding protein [Desmospora profundinema]